MGAISALWDRILSHKILFLRIAITALALSLLGFKWNPSHNQIALLVIAVIPWLSSLFESVEIPGGWEFKFQKLEIEQQHQRAEIDTLRFLIEGFLTKYELIHLRKLASVDRFPFEPRETFRKELEHLLSLELIRRLERRGLKSLFRDRDDVKLHLEITERGKWYLKHRDAAE